MNREYFINKVLNGEEVSLDEVVKTRAQMELESIKAEAQQRIDLDNAMREAALKHEAAIVEMITLSERASAISREMEENRRRREEAIREFDAQEKEIGEKYRQNYSQFNRLYQTQNGEAFDQRKLSNPLTRELLERGADLSDLDYERTRISPPPSNFFSFP